MAIFDFYIMVDWSGGNSRTANRRNCIWIAQGAGNEEHPATESPRSRTEAIDRVIHLTCQFLEPNPQGRVLACFDFAFAYPRGFAQHLPAELPNDTLWTRVWDYLTENVQDDVGTETGRKPTNCSNRFDVANQLNELLANDAHPGPFWCADPNWIRHKQVAAQPIFLPQKQPQNFTSTAGVAIPRFRLTDDQVQSDYPFRLFGNGSVGSQMITGIPRLQQLLMSAEIANHGACRVWPFDTGWAQETLPWPQNDVRMVIAEIYPSVHDPLDDTVLDRGQVRAMWHWARDLDAEDQLIHRFQRPEILTNENEAIARHEEGWILH